MRSHPTWVRGLKRFGAGSLSVTAKVAPYVGAWIETLTALLLLSLLASHPTWVRGLKLRRCYN